MVKDEIVLCVKDETTGIEEYKILPKKQAVIILNKK